METAKQLIFEYLDVSEKQIIILRRGGAVVL